MTAAIFHLTNNDYPGKRYAIEQGANFNWLTLVIDEMYANWTPRGQIRTNYASANGLIKGSFNFLPMVVGQSQLANGQIVTGLLLKPYLTSLQTAALDWVESKMQSRTPGTPAVVGKNVWVYDIELVSPQDTVIRLIQGNLEVSLEVTR